MAFPQYINSSPYSRLNGAGTHVLVVPTVAAGDLLLLQYYHRNVAAGLTSTLSRSASWSTINIGTFNSARQYVLGRFVSGAAGTTTYNIEVIGASTYTNNAHIHIFRNVTLSSYFENISSLNVINATNPADSIVITTGQEELAINLLCMNNAVDIADFINETGGTWVLSRTMSASVDGKMSLFTASITTSGTIDGGIHSPSIASGLGINFGMALKPATAGAAPQTVTAVGLASGVGFGGVPIICPIGFEPRDIPHPAFLPQPAAYARALWPW